MLHKKILWIFLMLIHQSTIVVAQTQLGSDIRRYEDIISNNYMSTQFDNRYEGIKGTPFLFDVWTEGRIMDAKGTEYQNLSIKYDAYQHEILVNVQSRGSFYLEKNFARVFYMKDPKSAEWLKFILATDSENQQKNQYYQEVAVGKATLLEEFHITLIKADFQGAYSQDRPYDEFQKSSIYYLQWKDGTMSKLKTSRKGLINAFPDHEEEIKKFIKEQNIDPGIQTQLKQVVEYYNSL